MNVIPDDGYESDIKDCLQSARSRVRYDLRAQAFFHLPFEAAVTDHSFERVAEDLARQLATQTFSPSAAPIIDVPKPDWHARPCALIGHRDLLAFHALCTHAARQLVPRLEWSQQFRFNHHFDPSHVAWKTKKTPGWSAFNKASFDLLKDEYKFVLSTDISGFYENIDIDRLIRELRTALPGIVWVMA